MNARHALAAVPLAAALLALSVLVSVPGGRRSPERAPDPVRLLLDSLRSATADCVRGVNARREELDSLGLRLDSLRAAVARFESPECTVPASLYAEYLEAFDAYNAAVEEWILLADSIRAGWERCRELAGAHNRIVDSAMAVARPAESQ